MPKNSMNVIFLSGGSGKRLWPLSNDIRSKQFIPFFKDEKGNPESMVQRMYKHIRKIDPNAYITFATSKSQASELKNQLGDDIDISIEPCRKDTFPAIALAAAYLLDVMGVDREEAVVVCPVDPYVEDDYFLALQEACKLAKNSSSHLILLGKEPTSPSEKFGYIIPKNEDRLSEVSCFKEKPNYDLAKEYIKQGALWNMGVFAFKLGYVLDVAHRLIDFEDYDDLFEKYDNLKKISFDYAVVEHEPNISVLRFSGRWDDLGTWESLTDVMPEKTIGKVISKESINTRVINELDIPVITLGTSDLLVAASNEGILVSSLLASSQIKSVAAETEQGEIRYAEKSWGRFQVIDASNESLTINAQIKAGHRMSYHSHSRRDEVWTIVSGTGKVVVDGMSQHVNSGDVISISLGCRHTIIAETDIKLIEVQLGKEISASDKKKYDFED